MFIKKNSSGPDAATLIEMLVERLTKELPPQLIQNKRKVLSVNKVTRLLETTYLEVAEYKKTNNPGFIRRAILANKFKWALKGKGYPDDFVDVATEGLVVELSRKMVASS